MEDILLILIPGLLLFTPIAGLTLRFALKPMVDSIARLLEVRAASAGAEFLERRVALLEQELQLLRTEHERLAEQREFDARLAEPRR